MAATVTIRKRTKYLGMYAVIADVALDSSYPTGGEAVTASQFGLQALQFVLPSTAAGYMFEFDHTNGKIKAVAPTSAAAGAGTEVANTTNLSAVTVRVLAMGY